MADHCLHPVSFVCVLSGIAPASDLSSLAFPKASLVLAPRKRSRVLTLATASFLLMLAGCGINLYVQQVLSQQGHYLVACMFVDV